MTSGTRISSALVAAGLLLAGGLLAGLLLSAFGSGNHAASGDAFRSSIQIDPSQYSSETEEDGLLRELEVMSADEAEAIALTAYPGARTVEVELSNINGSVVYSVDLDSGLEVFVDAGTGEILAVE